MPEALAISVTCHSHEPMVVMVLTPETNKQKFLTEKSLR